MYLEHFKLDLKPFQITADHRFLWLSEKHKEALATLRYGILDDRGFVLLTGEVGTGKTMLVNQLISMLEMDTAVATLPDPDLESMDFYNLMADGLKMDRTFESKGAFLIHLRDFLYHSHFSGKKVLLIIDESQRLNHRLMEDIRVLSNIELHDHKLINIFFVGQQEFNNILLKPQNRALAQRITVRYHIEPLNQSETTEYITHRLKVAGGDAKIFDKKALDEVYRFSKGIPRLINIVCDHALLTAYSLSSKKIDAEIVKECAQELRIPGQTSIITLDPSDIVESVPDENARVDLKTDKEKKQGDEIQMPGHWAQRESGRPGRSWIWKLAYSVMSVLLLAIVLFAVYHFMGLSIEIRRVTDLLPKSQQSALKNEDSDSENHLQKGSGDRRQPDAIDTSANPEIGQTAQPDDGSKKETEPLQDIAQIPAESLAGTSSHLAPNESGQIAPLPLITDKIVVRFEFNSNEIAEKSYAELDSVGAYLTQHPDEKVQVRGYTDRSGSSDYNEAVSRFRASAVKSYLIGKGVAADNIIVFAMGDQDPVASNETPEGRSQNRRVEVQLVQETTQ
jgi:general secretion pathway protein A